MFNTDDSKKTAPFTPIDLGGGGMKPQRKVFGNDGTYRKYRKSLHFAMRSPGAWILAVLVGVLAASVQVLATTFSGLGLAAKGGADLGGKGLQSVAAAGPDWGVLGVITESGSPWVFVAIPATIWAVRVAVKG